MWWGTMATDNLGRELIEIVQIDQDFCNNTYGVAPCTASGDPSLKCFNTFKTCQDTENYDKGTKTITFKKNQCGGVEEYSIPILKGFSVTIPEINIFSRDTKNKQLGRFSSCSVSFNDVQFSDNHLDPYVSERTYNPLEQGTFWTKFLARNPYYEGWKIRLYDGEVGQTLAQMNVREYELEKISNPDSNGNVTVKATDLMRRFDKSKAIYPPPSDCRLKNDIVEGQRMFDTIGKLTTYSDFADQEKYMLIGGESNLFTRTKILSETDNGDGTYTYVTSRASSNNPAFEAGTRCENAALFSQTALSELVYYLLIQVYDVSELDSQINILNEMLLISTFTETLAHYISKPQPLGDIIGQLEKEMGFVTWYDDIEKIVKVKAITNRIESVVTLNQTDNLIQNKTKSGVLSTDRVSNVYLKYNAVIDWTDEQSNYTRSLLQLDSESSSANQYGSVSTYEVDTNWILFDSLASKVATRLLTQFKDYTREITFELDVKDDLRMAQIFKLAWRAYTDVYGNDEVIYWICTGRTRMGDRLKIKAQEFKFNVAEV